MPALWRYRRSVLRADLRNCSALVLLAAIALASPAKAQTAFDPASVAYVLCVTNETKKLALMMPPIAKAAVIEQAFHACGEGEARLRHSLAEKGVAADAADERLWQIKKFIRQSAPDDIERLRANSARPR